MLPNPFASFKQKKIPLAPQHFSPASTDDNVLSSLTSSTNTITTTEETDPGPKYDLKEVSKHTNSDDLWMIIHNKVYNVTQFIADHPGGAEVLFDCAGIDATLSFDDVGHSEDAIQMLEECCLGELSTNDKEFLSNINNLNNKRSTKQPPFTTTITLSSSSSSSTTSPSGDLSPISSKTNIRKKKHKHKIRQKLKLQQETGYKDKPSVIYRHRIEQLIEKFSIPVLICISIAALILYIYLQSVKWDY